MARGRPQPQGQDLFGAMVEDRLAKTGPMAARMRPRTLEEIAGQPALLGDEGPFLPYLELVQAIEQESVFDVREKAERLMLSTDEVNRALLAALMTAAQLE